jgi:Tfp pilus assembly PilM family ATPase
MRERMQLLEAFFAMVHSVKNLDELASDVIPKGIAANFSEPVGTDLIEDSKIVKYLNLNTFLKNSYSDSGISTQRIIL